MRVRYLSAFTCLTCCWVAAGNQADCIADENGYYFDLTSLQAKQDYVIKSGGREFKLNICAHITSETWNLDNPLTVGALYRGERGDISIGTVNKTLQIVDSDPLLVLSDGSQCAGGSSSTRASTAIRFICDNDVFGAGHPRLIAQLPPHDESPCAFLFEWKTHIACPTSKPSRAGGIIAVISAIVLILFVTYIVIGVSYRRYALGYRGFDQLPRLSIIPISALPRSLDDVLDWLRDIRDHLRGGARDIWPRSSSNWGPRRRGGFEPLAREEQEAMFRDNLDTPDGRFSIEDETDREGPQELAETSPPVPAKDTAKLGSGAIKL